MVVNYFTTSGLANPRVGFTCLPTPVYFDNNNTSYVLFGEQFYCLPAVIIIEISKISVLAQSRLFDKPIVPFSYR